MRIREFGSEIRWHLAFFRGSCELWPEFRPAAEGLVSWFYGMPVMPDGHDPQGQNDFISVEKTVDDAVQRLRERGIDHQDAMYGLSLGAVVMFTALLLGWRRYGATGNMSCEPSVDSLTMGRETTCC